LKSRRTPRNRVGNVIASAKRRCQETSAPFADFFALRALAHVARSASVRFRLFGEKKLGAIRDLHHAATRASCSHDRCARDRTRNRLNLFGEKIRRAQRPANLSA
jgi:hypothetical protein